MQPTQSNPLGNDDFRNVRRRQGLHLIAQVVLALSLAILLNYIAAHHYQRKDLTENQQFTLSPETRQYLANLDEKISIYVLIPEQSGGEQLKTIKQDLEKLLREYRYASRRQGEPWVQVEFIDIYQQRTRAQELASRFNLTEERATIIVASASQHREIMGTDLYVVRDEAIVGFKGEAVFTEAILNIANKEQDTIYFLTGHGEMRPTDTDPARGLSQLALFLRQRNIRIEPLDLTRNYKVPADADLVIVAAPLRALQAREQQALSEYLSNDNGKLMVFLKPQSDSGLNDLFYEWGILADPRIVVGKDSDFYAQGGDLIVRHFGAHPITNFLIDHQLPLILGRSQAVRIDLGAPDDGRRDVVEIIASSGPDPQTGEPTSWAKPYWALADQATFNPALDLPGPVSLGAIAQRRVGSTLGLNIPGGKLVVFGNADFIGNHYFQSLGNSVLIHNAINWCLERTLQLNIPPRALNAYQIPLSRDEMRSITLRIALIPLLIGVLGAIIVWRRRH